MRRILKIVVGVVVIILIAGVIASRGNNGRQQAANPGQPVIETTAPEGPTQTQAPQPTAPAGGFSMTYRGPAERVGDYAAVNVTFKNDTNADVTNPQLRVSVRVADRDWSCQGYEDPISGKPVVETGDVVAKPLVIGAGKEVPLVVYCRIPPTPMESAQVTLR